MVAASLDGERLAERWIACQHDSFVSGSMTAGRFSLTSRPRIEQPKVRYSIKPMLVVELGRTVGCDCWLSATRDGGLRSVLPVVATSPGWDIVPLRFTVSFFRTSSPSEKYWSREENAPFLFLHRTETFAECT